MGDKLEANAIYDQSVSTFKVSQHLKIYEPSNGHWYTVSDNNFT